MKREILINVADKETRVAILEDDLLVELLVDREGEERHVGDIYKGTVSAVLPGMQAAFVDIGMEKSGFLHVSDLADFYASDEEDEDNGDGAGGRKGGGRARTRRRSFEDTQIQDVLKRGQEILVQVTKEPISTKGPRLTGQISLPGRFLVFMPGVNHVGVSRKIENREERARLRALLNEIRPASGGVIVRTVGEETSNKAFQREIEGLAGTWKKIEKKAQGAEAPSLVHQEATLTSGLVRDVFSDKVDGLIVDEKPLYDEIRRYMKDVSPDLMDRMKLHRDAIPLFDSYGIEEEIEKTLLRRVELRTGGHLVIEATEALVSIDVNTGRYTGKKDPEATILRTNLEAAREVARQLRLRDVGGIIVIDFIDMEVRANRKRVFQEFKTWLSRDRARTKAFEVSDLGLVEMTRQRVRPSLFQSLSQRCPTCDGQGRVLSPSTVARKIERTLRRVGIAGAEKRVEVRAHPEIALYLIDEERSMLQTLRKGYGLEIEIRDDPLMRVDEFKLYALPGHRALEGGG
ncbi:MAG: Rne/Rng family ribonuclease [Gemmatimonadetes bacterium]|nr:Rne/Rng family ribonuclease [Gemmatimonadota bacterium]